MSTERKILLILLVLTVLLLFLKIGYYQSELIYITEKVQSFGCCKNAPVNLRLNNNFDFNNLIKNILCDYFERNTNSQINPKLDVSLN